ncbi:MAG: methyl-accepting chemotaxis protein, partial [Chloroflexota bacterium]|nr:methyl-accepting chemotaxis protein [Chloroflexota bacterium]
SIRDAVVQSAAQIRQLGATSKQISSISEFIGDIAEQTNLLALNAAIEAARAGEHGRGFAVVAGEVRKLAARSANASSQINELTAKISLDTRHAIESMEMGVARAEDGSALAARAGQALQAILLAVQQTNDQIQNISAAAEEMTASSGEVVAAINNISHVVSQNSEATEQMSEMSQSNADVTEAVSGSAEQLHQQVNAIYASAEQLSKLASGLKAAAGRFRL